MTIHHYNLVETLRLQDLFLESPKCDKFTLADLKMKCLLHHDLQRSYYILYAIKIRIHSAVREAYQSKIGQRILTTRLRVNLNPNFRKSKATTTTLLLNQHNKELEFNRCIDYSLKSIINSISQRYNINFIIFIYYTQ